MRKKAYTQPFQPHTMTVWPIQRAGLTKSNVYIDHHKSMPSVMAYVKAVHPDMLGRYKPDDVVVFRQHATDTVDVPFLLTIHVLHEANVRAVLENYGEANVQAVPRNDYVHIRAVEEAEASHGGVELPEIAREKPQEGYVVSVGPGKYVNGALQPMRLEPKQHVMYNKFAGTELTLPNGEKVLLVKESDVLVTLQD